ncbi:MAG: DPP IV N-terminal domain-containing protein [Gemmatimonadota bacterium]
MSATLHRLRLARQGGIVSTVLLCLVGGSLAGDPAAAQIGAPAPVATTLVQGPGSANYRQAARFAPYKLRELVHSTSVSPNWIEGSESFWYEWETSDGAFYMIVDPVRRQKRPIFDNDVLAAELTRITRDPWDGQHLPIRAIRFIDANTVQFEVESTQDEEEEEEEVLGDELEDDQEQETRRRRAQARKKVHHFEYDVGTQTLRELLDFESPDNHPSWADISPDGQTVVYARNDNLYMTSAQDYARILDARRGLSGAEADTAEWRVEVTETQLTQDGEENYRWGSDAQGDTDVEKEENRDRRRRAGVSWSSDSRRLALVRSDQRNTKELWVIHSTGNDRPELESYKYDMPGDSTVTQREVWIYDLVERRPIQVQYDEWRDEASVNITNARQFEYPDSEEPTRSLWLAPGSDQLHFVRLSRDRKRADLMVADAATGQARPVIEDRLNTYIETENPERLPNGDILWWSERDGWGHIYRYGANGELKGRLTQGAFSVQEITAVDPASGTVFFTAAGREDGEDPYYQHLYRVNIDGSGVRLLAPGDFDHRTDVGASSRFFVDNYSRVNTVPASTLLDANGNEVLALETADLSRLAASGWHMPEPFTVKADDGITDLYGVMYLPFDFDPTKIYPIIEYVYPGPQTESVAKAFGTGGSEAALAQFGFVVITVGNRGGHPSRSKWYHNYGYGNLRDYGLADKKAAVEQLADRHSFIDIDRVGIYGHSGGGFMSTAAMLVYPDFFKVAVSSAGNHTNEIYNRNWSETHHGVTEVVNDDGSITFEYDIDSNPELAENLKGHLLLTTGDVDNNVHPGNTLRMAEALIRANKRFDFFIFPGQRHGFGNMSDYWHWLRAEYFVKHLLGDDRWNVDLIELEREQEQN